MRIKDGGLFSLSACDRGRWNRTTSVNGRNSRGELANSCSHSAVEIKLGDNDGVATVLPGCDLGASAKMPQIHETSPSYSQTAPTGNQQQIDALVDTHIANSICRLHVFPSVVR